MKKNNWYIETFSIIIEKLAKNQNVMEDNILFFGSSAGGFMSICLATILKKSHVLINNPQFTLFNHKVYLNRALDAVSSTFDGLTSLQIIEKYKYRFDLIELFKRENYAPYITYYVNVKSKRDITLQTSPFVLNHYEQEQFKGLNIIYYSEDIENPHNPFPSKHTIYVLKLYAKNKLYNLKTDNEPKIIYEEKYPKQLENEIKQLKNSKSWKITKPLRDFTRLLEKFY